jgi:hypothetical protein
MFDAIVVALCICAMLAGAVIFYTTLFALFTIIIDFMRNDW